MSDKLTALAERIVHLQAQREEIDAAIEQLKGLVIEEAGIGSTTLANGMKVNVREPNRIFDVDAAMSALTPEQQALAMKVDPAKVKAQIAPALAEAFYKPGKGKCVVTVA